MNASLAILALSLVTGQTARLNATSPMGTNLGPLKYWTTEWVFTDAFKQSSPWITACNAGQQPDCALANAWDTGEESLLDLDQDGWIRSLPAAGDAPTYWFARTLMFYGIDGHFPGGQYIVRYDGEGTLRYAGSATKNLVQSSPGRDVIDVVPSRDGIIIELTATDPNHTGNYLKNIRVIMPGFEANYQTQPFHPTFLATLAKFKVLRFMMWMETNGSAQSTWNGRPLTTDARYSTPKGVPLETMIALANANGSDPWFNIPHLATDDYITRFANAVRAQLGSTQKVYVEYSNEAWNGAWGFTQSTWMQQQGLALWPGGTATANTKQINWFGKRTAEMCDLFKAAWGADRGRVVCVLGAQAANAWTASQAADCPLWTQGAPCSAHGIDAVAIAPYFDVRIDNGTNRTELTAMAAQADYGVTSIINEVQNGGVLSGGYTGGSLAEASRRMVAAAAVTNARGLALIAYEGGMHLVDPNDQADLQEMFRRANRDARFGAVYDAYFASWRAAGGRLFAHFLNTAASNRNGPFGARENYDQATTPKLDAVNRFIDNNPQWWTNGPVTPPANNPVPTLATIAPTRATVGAAGFTLTLTGTNFIGATTVSFGGANVAATRVSATQLTAVIPASALTTAAALNVTVTNPGPGGGTTASQVFTVLKPLYYSIRSASLAVTGAGTVANEDIIRYDLVTGQKTMFFDGSVAGPLAAANIDAFFVNPDGTILMSFDVRVTIPGMAGDTVAEPCDIVMYNPTTRAWTFYFDGSDVGLSTTTENIDAIALLPDGRMLISTTGAASVPGVAAAGGEDVIAFSPTGLGVNTTGTWAMYFDGSRVGLGDGGANEGIDGLSVLADGSLLISTYGASTVTGGLRFTGDDLVRFAPTALGTGTAGTFSLWLGAATAGISGGVDGVQY